MANEQSIGIAPDSSGKKVRNLEVTTYIAGVPTTVEMQVISISDGQGNTIDGNDFADAANMATQIHLLRRICGALEEIVDGTFLANIDDVDDQPT